jgi:signal transduction histidine kinase
MKKFEPGSLRFAIRMKLHIQLFLLVVLPAFNAVGQLRSGEYDGAVFTRDTIQMRKYSIAAGSRSISPDSAIALLNKAAFLAKKHKLRKQMVNAWRAMGWRKIQQGDVTGCQRYLDSAFALNEQLKDAELTCELNDLAASAYLHTAEYAKAATCYFRAVQAVEENKIEKESAVAKLYSNLGSFMLYLKEDSLATKYLLRARQHLIRVRPVDSGMLINIHALLGNAQLTHDTIAAIGYFREAYKMAEKFKDISLTRMAVVNLSLSYIQIGQYDTAAYFLNLARTATPPGESLVVIEVMAGQLAYYKKKYTIAERHLLYAQKLIQSETDEFVEVIYQTLSDIYAARGEYEKAYIHHKKFMEQYFKHKGDVKKTITGFMLNLQTVEHEKTVLRKQAEISSGEAAIKRQRSWIAAMCLVSVLLCVILIMAYRNYRNKKSLLNEQMRALLQDKEIERLTAEAEGADNERSRIAYDIHDGVLVRLANVKMNLTGLHGLAGDSHYQDMVGQLDMATRELRNTAHNLMPEILLEEGLEQAIFYFCKATEHASGLNIKFQLVGTTIPRLQPVVETSIYRIVQGLVQNVIQHARANECLVQFQYADYLCSITVEDDGQGIDNVLREEGYGFKSIRNRIKILMGTFDIDSTKGQGTTVYIEFDVRPFILHQGGNQ